MKDVQKSSVDAHFIRQCLDAQEMGDGRLYAALQRGKALFVGEEWLVYNGVNWEADHKNRSAASVEEVVLAYAELADDLRKKMAAAEKEEAAKLAGQIKKIGKRIDKLRTERGVRACLKFATIGEDGLTASREDFDQKPYLLACRNGVVDLRNGKLRPGKPEDMISKNTGIDYPGLKAVKPKWFLQTIHEMFPGHPEMIDFFQIVYGSAITGYPPEQMYFPIGLGGSNGKSKCFLQPTMTALGDYASPVAPEVVIDLKGKSNAGGPTPHLVALRGLRMGMVSELDERSPLAEAQVKAQTGQDRIAAKPLYSKEYIYFTSTHTLFVPSNHRPLLSGDDAALWRRLVFIPFLISFTDNPTGPHERLIDRSRPEKIMQELPEILAWMVEGCLRWQAAGRKIELPPLVLDYTNDARVEEDIIGSWLEKCCIAEPAGELIFKEAYVSFSEWYQEMIGHKTPSQKWFGKHLALKTEKRRKTSGPVYVGYRLRW